MKHLQILFLVLLSSLAFGQNDCDCERNYNEVYQKIRDNYAAYDMKVNAASKPAFDALNKKIASKAKGVKDPKACFEILKEWTDFFQDNHLFINFQTSFSIADSPEVVAARASKVLVQKYTSESPFERYLKENQANLDPAEGVWESDDKEYRLGVIKDATNPKKLYGFLLTDRDKLWVKGKTKFELEKIGTDRYKTKYYYSDFSAETTLTRLVKNILAMDNIYKFTKVSPTPTEFVTLDEQTHALPDYRVERIDSSTTLIVLPPFTIPNAPLYINELVSQNEKLILGAKNLIIDMRNNPGGDDNAFDALFPYIADGPIIRKGSKMRATQENLILLNHELRSIQDFPQFKLTLEPKLRQIIREMTLNMGTMITAPDKEFNYKSTDQMPKKVVVLVNKNTASTAESISLEAKQSPKVIIMGRNTKGAADYTEVRDWGLPCFGWRLAIPLGISYRLPTQPMENVGIKPDVEIPESEADWVNFTVKYLNTIK
jgi:hypothetical protein